ncbi:myb family transcription factor [Galdieria sulphuraria]|uniref:Myb family transcription factor n=1 Tax=Galdieria sulphuraria TaxID=130081 RepID=M2VYS4_GALSU|nr:myb family transcription factor [Galdieria sulphuraria]EME28446.1 myb family transcription factor [Galdieria sulphuraria]|eukprot:XP_005704966.1 myb family transcription factor [Galdieria sulphuraria]
MSEETVSEFPRQLLTESCNLLQNNERKFKNAWKLDEHHRFLVALKKFGHGNWRQIADYVETRSASQCQSHAQKYYLRKRKLASNANLKRSIFDLIDEDTLSVELGEEDTWNIIQKCPSKEAQGSVRSRSKTLQRMSTDSSVESYPIRELSTVDSELSTLLTFK